VGDDSFRDGITSVFHLKQSLECLEFGKTPPHGFDKLWHLFASQGQLQIIKTPFLDGKHVCTSSIQAVSLIQELKTLHGKGFSHGDIRAFNCVFSDTGSHLIDFDFGGRKVTYPKGYRTILDDGRRIPESVLESNRTIHKWHDVYALVKLLLEYHKVTGTAGSADEMFQLLHNSSSLLLETDRVDEVAANLLNSMELFLNGKSIEIKPKLELEMAVLK
jgi:serine/threonine protein kinase